MLYLKISRICLLISRAPRIVGMWCKYFMEFILTAVTYIDLVVHAFFRLGIRRVCGKRDEERKCLYTYIVYICCVLHYIIWKCRSYYNRMYSNKLSLSLSYWKNFQQFNLLVESNKCVFLCYVLFLLIT